jgi:alkyl sulfatase BDS1-like metallo-beta-lactamase superfamily hydrolase
MEISILFDFIAVKVDSIKAAELGLIRLNVINPDIKETLYVELSNGNLSNIQVDESKEADANLFIDKRNMTEILLGKVTLK